MEQARYFSPALPDVVSELFPNRSPLPPPPSEPKESIKSYYRRDRANFRHFIISDPAPAFSVHGFVREVLGCGRTESERGVSYAVYSHSPKQQYMPDEKLNICGCQYERGTPFYHHHILFYARTCVTDFTTKFKETARALTVEFECYQRPIMCPLSDFAAMRQCGSMIQFEIVGPVFMDMDAADAVHNYGHSWKRRVNSWTTNDPIWELHTRSQVRSIHDLIVEVNKGAFKSVLHTVLASLVNEVGFVNYQSHNMYLNLDCGVTQAQCRCCECLCPPTSQHDTVFMEADDEKKKQCRTQ